ncbi:spindle and kinetochore-associated protein 2-like isoform X1 [Salvelinus fontinalis]|uniref:spindle and kinetochore-associated protein 2-like isoform X1 n=1 Tax=Salvelinus fontinalis TaxID=8038 RepID=UPI00248613BB|nr:spindle and kinetochore-associated protein 2-like isoform X1 [Salvelinus fontinalis]
MNLTSGFIFTGLPGECKLFNMEIAVDKLEAMFQKAEADMEYMEKRLRLEFLTNAPENGATEENPVKLLENLSAIKVRHAALCTQVQEIAAEQKQSMDSIRAHLDTTVQLVQQLQQTAEVELLMSMEPSAQEQPQCGFQSSCRNIKDDQWKQDSPERNFEATLPHLTQVHLLQRQVYN